MLSNLRTPPSPCSISHQEHLHVPARSATKNTSISLLDQEHLHLPSRSATKTPPSPWSIKTPRTPSSPCSISHQEHLHLPARSRAPPSPCSISHQEHLHLTARSRTPSLHNAYQCRRVTRNFSGQGRFLKTRALR